MPEHHIGEIIDQLTAQERFQHPDMLAASLADLTDHLRQLDELIEERYERLGRLADDQPELDDLAFHAEARYQRDLIAVLERRRAEDMTNAVAVRRRLEAARAAVDPG